MRGLASGSNDPYTAVTALDLAATALVDLLNRPPAASALTDSHENPQVLLHWPEPDDCSSLPIRAAASLARASHGLRTDFARGSGSLKRSKQRSYYAGHREY